MFKQSDVLRAKVLIVDDKEANVLLLESALRGAGYTGVASTIDPRQVCALHLKNRYDLIMLDLEMPGMDGFQVMEGLKEIESEGYLPVLAVTAHPGHKLRALQSGAKDFISKPLDLAEVTMRVRNMLEVRLLHLEMRNLYERVVEEKNLSEKLLLNVLPYAIAERLKARHEIRPESFTEVVADRFAEVTVLFADIEGFTKFSQGVSAEVLVEVLDDIFSRFDDIADSRGLEKIKTIGDAYMAASGLPVPAADHASRAAHMALDMHEAMDRFNLHSHYQLRVRIGISTGPVVAGVVGKRKFLYDLWGDVVNTASRMESHGLAGRIQVSESTKKLLREPFILEERGAIDIKGKGAMRTWFLNGRSA